MNEERRSSTTQTWAKERKRHNFMMRKSDTKEQKKEKNGGSKGANSRRRTQGAGEPKYYNERSKQSSLRYRLKNVDQINLTGKGIKALFREQAEKRGVAVNRYLINMARADAEGNIVVISPVDQEQVPDVVRAIGGTAVTYGDAQKILDNMDPETRRIVRSTADGGGMTEQSFVTVLASALSHKAAAGNAEMLFRCLEANGADRNTVRSSIRGAGLSL